MEITMQNLFPERVKNVLESRNSRSEYPFLRTLVTGGAGSIGSSVVKKLLSHTNSEIWVIDNDESRIHTLYESFDPKVKERLKFFVTDIRDLKGLHQRIDFIKPDMIIHAAALKHVSILERQPRDAFLTNVIGTSNMVNYLQKNRNIGMVFVSSDKAANPTNILGKTKYIGELILGEQISIDKELGTSRHLGIVRFGNVFLSRGSVIETFIRQIKRGEPVTITDAEMTRYFMDIEDAADLIIEVAAQQVAGISIFKMGAPIKILDLAIRLQEFLDATNRNVEIIGVKNGEKIHEDLFSQEEEGELNDLGSILNSTKLSRVSTALVQNIPDDDLAARDLINIILSKVLPS
jgi:FlaA1/EpsC-like NDP-sugar epimerase